ncbi:MAG: hypothetical protein QOK19_34 [Solirubrobacteraceae bacterium]|nr:hypothetical protein [Solirubrobacteraceae bacterium]
MRRLRARPLVARRLSGLHDVLVPPLRTANALLRRISAAGHRLQYRLEGFLRPAAEWFDHEVDVQWQWPAMGRSSFLERGVLSALAIRPRSEVLDLCCGDGFYASRFYAARASRVVAIDLNESAISHARRHHARANIEYRLGDIRDELPAGPFDNVIWDSAIHHFTLAEAAIVLASLHRCLRDDGVLSGFADIEPDSRYPYVHMELADASALADLLAAEFAHVAVVETLDGGRQNLYFFASDVRARLPFAEGVRAPGAPVPAQSPEPAPSRFSAG